jgi:methyltransferase (TIGR00027 family)
MLEAVASRTALGAAVHRAAHQALENGAIFTDPLASLILGPQAASLVAEEAADPARRPMRLFLAARSSFAEAALAGAVGRGVRQVVVLGAGYDTFALRNPYGRIGVRVFEVDHPATQAAKRDRLRESALMLPPSLRFVPCDFEHDTLAECLAASGFDTDQPAFFIWLGVVMYLTRDAFHATLETIASVHGAEVVFDYSEPIQNYAPAARDNLAAVVKRVAALGEPWLSDFDPLALMIDLRALGFEEIEDLDLRAISRRYFGPTGGLDSGTGPHLIRARRT